MKIASIIAALWIAFYSYWAISALSAKKTARKERSWTSRSVRLGLILLILVVVRLTPVRRIVVVHSSNRAAGILGLLICIVGLSFAVWARVHLGKNWGVPMSLREGHELVTSGPYRYVRHPIYSGILLGLLGSGLAAGWPWFLPLITVFPFFIYSARVEERLMMRQFPEAYPEYRKRTRTLIPFVY
jgi:protein-S-isoprenylcysteine O-methyltransferase Ste14